jgi:hypothetical protein
LRNIIFYNFSRKGQIISSDNIVAKNFGIITFDMSESSH